MSTGCQLGCPLQGRHKIRWVLNAVEVFVISAFASLTSLLFSSAFLSCHVFPLIPRPESAEEATASLVCFLKRMPPGRGRLEEIYAPACANGQLVVGPIFCCHGRWISTPLVLDLDE